MRGVRRWLGANALRFYGVLAFLYLFLPIAYVTVFSFNDGGRSNIIWNGFTLKNWSNPCGAPDVCQSVQNSLVIGVIATLISTILGTMVAFALARLYSGSLVPSIVAHAAYNAMIILDVRFGGRIGDHVLHFGRVGAGLGVAAVGTLLMVSSPARLLPTLRHRS